MSLAANVFTWGPLRVQPVVVIIIAILAAIAIPKFANTKSKAYVAAMKSDLRTLVTAERAFFSDSTCYTTATNLTTRNTWKHHRRRYAGRDAQPARWRDLRHRRQHHEPHHHDCWRC
jgi:hypothetical protein